MQGDIQEADRHLEATRFQRVLTFLLATVLPAVLLVVGVSFWWWGTPSPPLFAKAISLACPLLVFYSYSSIITNLTILPDGTLECSSLLRKTAFHVTDIREIDMRLWNKGHIKMTTHRSKVFLYRQMPGALDAMRRIASNHPLIRVRQ